MTVETCIDKENEMYTDKYGQGYYDNGIQYVPRVIECGRKAREWDAPLCTNVDKTGAQKRLKWYRHKK
ncbi:MAG: hypothetical protein MJZ01_05430 [Bacteroidales bacterium]|nr:hypothetical protein [Bacteroidales bacterium]